ncbi:hypothetical protein LZ012_03860 [Dechloromonas sp. XY25]|uniref:Uncharacterized protein n=1 Tax=Dechloromonas hankyongensis TaxID=2908002 RepID=A0ABS9JZ62_9RHOO|nr:hypothetical protein [Dechloromonas hankyongensis]MCG2576129.1 hypothetical protein [Dechloromonas hankyongensis]
MDDLPEDDLEESRAAFAPLLDATAAILPWVAKSRPARFDTKLNERWCDGCKRLDQAWSNRHGTGGDDIRPAIFNLYAIALETADADCLRLGEALAGAADRLEDGDPSPRLIAALTGAIECLHEPDGLEHGAFAERAHHFAERLESAASSLNDSERSTVVDQLFVDEAHEQLEMLRDALAALPPDAYVLASEALKLAQHAEMLEIWGVMHLARQFAECVTRHGSELDSPAARDALDALLHTLSASIDAVVV